MPWQCLSLSAEEWTRMWLGVLKCRDKHISNAGIQILALLLGLCRRLCVDWLGRRRYKHSDYNLI